MTTDRLTSLPVELLTKVLEVLPVREMYRLRIVSSRLRDLVDENEDSLTRLTLDFHHQRIATDAAWLFDLEGLDLLDIMHRYTCYYERFESLSGGSELMIPIDRLVLSTRGGDLHGLNVRMFWGRFIRCHRWMHSHSSSTKLPTYGEIQRDWAECEARAVQLHDPVNDVEYVRARVQDSTLLSGRPCHIEKHDVPALAITYRYGLRDLRDLRLDPTPGMLMERFGLPWPLKWGFGYCVKTKGMRNMVRIACVPRKQWVLEQKPSNAPLLFSRFRQAALLEEVFIF